ncbi:mCG148147 [Mus musculus]|nr:mCG148147 [Mus musculus]
MEAGSTSVLDKPVLFLKENNVGWRDGSVVKSTDCSCRGPEFNSQQPHGGSQPSVMGLDAFWCV